MHEIFLAHLWDVATIWRKICADFFLLLSWCSFGTDVAPTLVHEQDARNVFFFLRTEFNHLPYHVLFLWHLHLLWSLGLIKYLENQSNFLLPQILKKTCQKQYKRQFWGFVFFLLPVLKIMLASTSWLKYSLLLLVPLLSNDSRSASSKPHGKFPVYTLPGIIICLDCGLTSKLCLVRKRWINKDCEHLWSVFSNDCMQSISG